MNQGARDANDAARHYSESQHRDRELEHQRRVEALLVEIRDLLRWRFRDDPPPVRTPEQEL